jgi:anti-sigma regulatory factor (Ser/Thr protein kinase)
MEVAGAAVLIDERSAVGEARRRATELATAFGMDVTGVARVALVATELATNILKHARSGHCLFSAATGAAGNAIDVLAIDRGPGIEDVQRAYGDGFSTSGTPGTGIGAVRRQSVEFDLYTDRGRGTIVFARVGPDPARTAFREHAVEVRAFAAPRSGETVCGDHWAARTVDGSTRLIVADGLGHGPGAAEASREAVNTFDVSRAKSPVGQLEEIHAALRSTRGAAVALAWIEPGSGSIRFTGLGNISAALVLKEGGQGMVSVNGTAGHIARSFREFQYATEPGCMVVMHSDGISARWDLADYPGLRARGPAIIAGVLMRDFARNRDDASVVVAYVRPLKAA